MNHPPREVRAPAVREAQWASLSPYLRQSCGPIRQWLQDPDVVEIMCNRPGEVWVEALGRPTMERFEVPELTRASIMQIAERVAAEVSQSVNEETPLLSAAMPHGERFQGVLSPAAPDGGAFSIRKQVISYLPTHGLRRHQGDRQTRCEHDLPAPMPRCGSKRFHGALPAFALDLP